MRLKSPLSVFISFKTEEKWFAEQLNELLRKKGYNVWWQASIQCGKKWNDVIDEEVKKAGAIIVLWSHRSIKSQWVKHEASQAIVRGVYAPVRIDMMQIEDPYGREQATDLIDWKGEKGRVASRYSKFIKKGGGAFAISDTATGKNQTIHPETASGDRFCLHRGLRAFFIGEREQ